MNKESLEKNEQLNMEQELKERAGHSIEKAKELILQNFPKEEILSIYVKGSYVQDELQPDSDVDLVVVLKDEKYLPAVYELSEKFGNTVEPSFQIVAYTLKELQTGEMALSRTKSITPISVFVKHLDHLPLIYGSRPEGKLFTRTDKKDLIAHLTVFNETFLPNYEKGTFKFKELVKQVLWLTEREQRVIGNLPEYSWRKLVDSVHDDGHIIHMALRLRRQREFSKSDREKFIAKLKDYLNALEGEYLE